MGLTFQQKFYQVPNVYMILDNGNPPEVYAILEEPDSDEEAIELLKNITSQGFLVQYVNFDDLVIKGKFLEERCKDD